MKTTLLLAGALVSTFTCFAELGVSPGLAATGFATNGAFQMQVTSGPLQIEYSTNLVSWTPLESGKDKVVDQSSANSEWRFYRARTANGFASNVVGFVRIPVQPGKMAVVASPFMSTLHLDKPQVRKLVFGSETPSVQISLTTNGKQTAYTFDELDNNFSPPVPPIAWGTGFIVRNTGKAPIHVAFGGELPHGTLKRAIPQGETLVGALVPKPGPAHDAIGAVGIEGAQLMVWNEQQQSYQTNTFSAGHWSPPLGYKPGRGIFVKFPEPSLQTTFSPTK